MEALTGLKAARLFRELDVRGNGFVTLEEWGNGLDALSLCILPFRPCLIALGLGWD